MSSTKIMPVRWYRGTRVPMVAIRRFARDVGRCFRPEKIYLFGSRAYGKPHADSDVDILVIMPTRNQLDQAVKIERACDPPFPLDILVRTPTNFQRRLAEGDSLLRRFAVGTRYPGDSATKRQATSAQRSAAKVRVACRAALGFPLPGRRRSQ